MQNMTKDRLLELADFFQDLPVERFDHNSWFSMNPDGGLSACIGGYGVLNMSKSYDVQRLRENITQLNGIRMRRNAGQQMAGDDYLEIHIKFRLEMINIDWAGECEKLFGFDHHTMRVLFSPNSDFWRYLPSTANITPSEVALALRYLAYKPSHNLDYNDYFVPTRLREYIVAAQSGYGHRTAMSHRQSTFDPFRPYSPYEPVGYTYTSELETTPEMRRWMNQIWGADQPPVEAAPPEPAPVVSMQDWLGEGFMPATPVPISQPMELLAA